MKKCIILACTHFFFGVIYSLGIMLLSPETAGFLVLLVIFPLALTMSAFYIWIFSSLTITMNTLGMPATTASLFKYIYALCVLNAFIPFFLELRKQHVKALMYRRLHRLLVFSLIMVVVIFILNMFAFSGRNEVDWAAKSWKWRWIMLDGLLNILYFIVFIVIVILWRPTSNNQRYGLEQISQDEEEALDLENQLRRAEGLGPRPPGYQRTRDEDDAAIFEVGDDDFSDDGHDGQQKVKLVSVAGRKSEDRSSTAGATNAQQTSHRQREEDHEEEEEEQ